MGYGHGHGVRGTDHTNNPMADPNVNQLSLVMNCSPYIQPGQKALDYDQRRYVQKLMVGLPKNFDRKFIRQLSIDAQTGDGINAESVRAFIREAKGDGGQWSGSERAAAGHALLNYPFASSAALAALWNAFLERSHPTR
jgi:hypothetical protein